MFRILFSIALLTDGSAAVLFFITSLIWLIRSRLMGNQVSGLILPAVIYVIVLMVGLNTARRFSWIQSLSIVGPAIVLFVFMFFVAMLCAQVSPRGERWAN
jgi:hypothetical protein